MKMKQDDVPKVQLLLSRRRELASKMQILDKMTYSEHAYLTLDGQETNGLNKDEFFLVQNILEYHVQNKLREVDYQLGEYGIKVED